MTVDEEREAKTLRQPSAPSAWSTFITQLDEVLGEVRALLIHKNRVYGNSALEPIRIFSKCDRREQIRVRIDDKLSRIMEGDPEDVEDTVRDLLGYLILDSIAEKLGDV